MTWKKLTTILLLVVMVLIQTSCAPNTNDRVGSIPAGAEEPAGFWLGLWHGFILPVTFVVSLFSSTVGVYETHNSGGWYNFGFTLAIILFYGGGANTAGRSRKKRRYDSD